MRVMKLVADPWLGENILGFRGVAFDLLPESLNVSPQRCGLMRGFAAPYGAEKL